MLLLCPLGKEGAVNTFILLLSREVKCSFNHLKEKNHSNSPSDSDPTSRIVLNFGPTTQNPRVSELETTRGCEPQVRFRFMLPRLEMHQIETGSATNLTCG